MKKPGRKRFLPSDADRAIAAEMKLKRGHLRLSQEELGRRIGLSAATINRYEMLRRGPTAQDLAAIESILGPCRPSGPGHTGATVLGAREDALSYGHVSDPDRKVRVYEASPSTGDSVVQSADGRMVGLALDDIEDPALRRRARMAALAAIDEERAKDPSEPVAGKSGSRARHS